MLSRATARFKMAESTIQSLADRLLTLDGIIERQTYSKNVSEEDTHMFVASMVNGNTKSKTKGDVNRFKEWLSQNGRQEEVESISPGELDMYMARYFLSIRKRDNTEYEPDTLKSMQSSIQRHRNRMLSRATARFKMAESTIQSLADRLLTLDGIIERQTYSKNVSEEDTHMFVASMVNGNTKSKTKGDVNRFKEWLSQNGRQEEIEGISPGELDMYMARYFLSIRKRDNTEYEPDTLKSMQSSIQRYIQGKHYAGNILTDDSFFHSRQVLSSKRKALKQTGLGNKKNRADPFTDEEIEIMRNKALLGNDNPEAMINGLWLNNTLHFGLRGRQEHLSMLWGDLELNITPTGREFLSFTETATKTRSGVNSDPRQFIPKMFDQPGDNNYPVALYKAYADKRPDSMCTPESRFYIGVNRLHTSNGQWFTCQPIGKNKLGQIAKTMSDKAGFHSRHVNHSGRKTCISKLLDANCPPTEVAQLSGHKNLMSLNHYNTASLQKQIQMSSIVHGRGDCTSSDPVAATRKQQTEPVASTSSSGDFNQHFESESDDELVNASQQIEEALKTI